MSLPALLTIQLKFYFLLAIRQKVVTMKSLKLELFKKFILTLLASEKVSFFVSTPCFSLHPY